jgi:phosphate transport system protein
VIVTHNMQQAGRVSDRTAFFTTEVNTESDRRTGVLVEYDKTTKMFSNPATNAPRPTCRGGSADGRAAQDLPPRPRQARGELARLAALVAETIPRATSVLLDGDLEGAEYIIRGDDEIDARCVELEEALPAHPRAAGAGGHRAAPGDRPDEDDLRGRAQWRSRAQHLQGCAPHLRARARSQAARHHRRMGEQAQQLYGAAIEAFVESDAAKAAAIDDMDAYLDALQKQFIQAIFESQAVGRIDLQVAVQLAFVARFYERIGDHAVNIGERVRFVVTGWVPDHKKPQRPKVELDDADMLPTTDEGPGTT